MSHRVLYIEKSENLRLYLDNLEVIVNNNEIHIPISDIMILVIDNYRSSLSVPLINKLVDNNVCTILCGVDHLPKTNILPINGNFAQSGNLNKQINWNEDNKKLVHQLIVKAKIYNQIEILKTNNKDFDVITKLFQFLSEVQLDDVTNREGLAAKMYFREMYGDDFVRFNEDVINAGLNYGYAVFRALISSIIVAKGYLPNLGIFHKGKQNMFNLSDDVIEVFRPIVDNYVLNNMMEDILFKQEHREELIQLTTKKVMIDDRKQTIANAIYVYIESILKVLETGDHKDFIYPLPYCYDI
jgi:CRISPR-associated protein Cas1